MVTDTTMNSVGKKKCECRWALKVHQGFQLQALKQTPLGDVVECFENRFSVSMLRLPMVLGTEVLLQTCRESILSLIAGLGGRRTHLVPCHPVHQEIMVPIRFKLAME
jgi:hypothetical protein